MRHNDIDASGMGRLVRRPVGALRALGFWGAIVVPAAYVPLLVGGLDSRTGVLLAGLVGLNLLCLLLGHDYSP